MKTPAIYTQRFKATLAEISALLFVFSIWAFSQNVVAEESTTLESFSSLWLKSVAHLDHAQNEQEEGFPALQLETDVQINVTGPIARVLVKQRFNNPSQYWAEGEYVYPLPENASAYRLRMYIGDRTVEGQIQEKAQAAKTFAVARAEGKRASLLSNRRTNEFSTQVTNIAPQEQISIEFEYQQWLDFKDGRYDLRMPMVSTPSYIPESLKSEHSGSVLSEMILPDNDFRGADELPDNPVSISVNIDAGVPLEVPKSESHKVTIKRIESSKYEVNLKGDAELSNRDFLLSWAPLPSAQPTVTVLKEIFQEESYGLLMVMPPQEDFSNAGELARELVFVLDVSGSMQGESILQAKAAMNNALDELDENDRFNIIWFSNHASSLFANSQSASSRNLAVARNKIKNLSADGGTNMLPALSIALSDKNVHKRISRDKQIHASLPLLRQVIFITDGAVGNEAELFTTIRQSLGNSRLFTVGIGSAPNSYFMRKAARAGRGTFTYVSKPQEVEEKVGELFNKLRSPALTHLDIDFQGYSPELLPDPLPDVYLGEPLYVVFRSQNFPEYAQVSGMINGQHSYLNLTLNEDRSSVKSDQRSDQEKGIASEWARRKIQLLMEDYRDLTGEEKTQLRTEIINLAIKHHQVSKFTSLVAVDVLPERSGGVLQKTKIASNLPKGFQLAQTSTGLWFYLYSGGLCLLAGCLLLAGREYLFFNILRKRSFHES